MDDIKLQKMKEYRRNYYKNRYVPSTRVKLTPEEKRRRNNECTKRWKLKNKEKVLQASKNYYKNNIKTIEEKPSMKEQLTTQKSEPIKKYWHGEALTTISNHIIQYKMNRNEQYFQENLYPAFNVLINYNILRYANRHLSRQEDMFAECYIVIMKAIEKWDITRNAFSYFTKVIQNSIMLHQKRLFLKKRDIRREIYIDGMEEHVRDKISDQAIYMPPVEEEENKFKNLDLEKLFAYGKSLKPNSVHIRYYRFLEKIISGEIKLRENDTPSQRVDYIAGIMGIDRRRMKSMSSRFALGFKRYIGYFKN